MIQKLFLFFMFTHFPSGKRRKRKRGPPAGRKSGWKLVPPSSIEIASPVQILNFSYSAKLLVKTFHESVQPPTPQQSWGLGSTTIDLIELSELKSIISGKKIHKITSVIATNILTNESFKFNSTREAADFTGCGQKRISSGIRFGYTVGKQWKFKNSLSL